MTSRRLALKLFTGVTDYDLSVLEMLRQIEIPCYYGRLHALLVSSGYSMDLNTYSAVLRNGVDNGLIMRSRVSGNVLYSLTLEGKKLLLAFCCEVDRIVAERIRLHGNGFDFPD